MGLVPWPLIERTFVLYRMHSRLAHSKGFIFIFRNTLDYSRQNRLDHYADVKKVFTSQMSNKKASNDERKIVLKTC